MKAKVAPIPAKRAIEIGRVSAMSAPNILVVCLPWSSPACFADDVRGECSACHQPVRHRPHTPPQAQIVCTACIRLRAETKARFYVTQETRNDIALYLSRAGGRS